MPRQVIRTLAILSITQILDWAFLFYAFALWAPRIMAETGWSDTVVFGGYSFALLTSGLAAPLAGRMVDRHGGRPVMGGGTLIGAAGLILLASSTQPLTYGLAFGLIGIGMAGALYDPAFATLTQVAGPQARRAISTLTLAGGFASTLAWPLTLWLLHALDWRQIALLYAGVLIILCTPLHLWGLPGRNSQPPPPKALRPAAAPLVEQPRVRGPEWHALGLFALVIMAHGFVTSAFSVHIIHALDAWGLEEALAVTAGACVGPAQVLARWIEMMFGRAIPALTLGSTAVGLLPLAFIGLLASHPSLTSAVIFALIYGASNGLLTIVRGVVPLALFGPEGYGRRLGLVSAPALAVKAGAPMVMGAVLTGHGVGSVLWIGLGCAVLAFIAMVALDRMQR